MENYHKYFPEYIDTKVDNAILRHMFPLTPIPPKTKEGWLVCHYDKVAAINDRFKKRKTDFFCFYMFMSSFLCMDKTFLYHDGFKEKEKSC